ncbi:MAG: RNA polymerase sigma-70 factor [Ignavibacteriales bacterium]
MSLEQNQIIEFTILFNKYKKRIYNYALKMLGDAMFADDITQIVFLRLYENFDKINNRESILFWLFRTTKNELMNHFRNNSNKKIYAQSIDPEDVDCIDSNSFAEQFEAKEYVTLLEKELDNLNSEQKEVFVLREYSGLSYKEIASVLKIDETTVKSRLFKCRQKIIVKFSKLIN